MTEKANVAETSDEDPRESDEYDPTDIRTWASYEVAGRTTYVQAPELEFDPEPPKTNFDQENECLTVDVNNSYAYIYDEGVECSSQSDHEKVELDTHDELQYLNGWLRGQDYIGTVRYAGTEPGEATEENSSAEEIFSVGEAIGTVPDVTAESVNTYEVISPTDHKEIAWEAYQQAWNKVDSMESMTKLETRTARAKFETWWEQNYGGDE